MSKKYKICDNKNCNNIIDINRKFCSNFCYTQDKRKKRNKCNLKTCNNKVRQTHNKFCSIKCLKVFKKDNPLKKKTYHKCIRKDCNNLCKGKRFLFCNQKCYFKNKHEKKLKCKKCLNPKCKKETKTPRTKFCSAKCRFVINPHSGINNPSFGKKRTKKTRKLLSKIQKKLLSSEHRKQIIRESNIRRIINGKDKFFKPSKAELFFVKTLEEKYNVKLETQFRIKNRLYDGKYGNILLEFDGIYWHSLPKAKKVDKEKNKLAKNNGYKLYRFPFKDEKHISKIINKKDTLFKKIFLKAK